MTSGFWSAFSQPAYGSAAARKAKPAGGGGAGEKAARVDPWTRAGRWCWRWRLHLTVLAVPAVWGGVGLGRAAADPQLVTWAAWYGRMMTWNIRDSNAKPDYPRPDPWSPVLHATLAMVVVVACVAALTLVHAGRWGRLCRREARWRTERLVEHRWDDAMLALTLTSKRWGRTTHPRLQRVRATAWGGFEGRVWFPKGFEMGRLAGGDVKIDQLVRRELELPGRGTCEQLVWSLPDEDEATYRVVEIVHKSMPRPQDLQVDDRPADDDNTLRIGVTARGFAGWDLDVQPFLRCSGASGKGKGHWGRWIVSQAVQKGWMVVIIDGAGAPEHRPWAGLPNVRYVKLRVDDPDSALAAFAGQISDVQRMAALRQALCDDQDLDDWKSMGDELRKEHPRILVVFDEFTALMGKAPEDDKTKQLRQHLGWMINRMLRLYRKYGVNAVIIDQVTYSGTWIGPDGLAQATQFVWCGMPNRTQQNMLSTGTRFPQVPNRPGYGVVGVAGDLEATPIVWAKFDRDVVKRVVAEQMEAWELAA